MELRNKRKGVPAPQQDSRPSKDSSGNASKRVKSKSQHPPERSSRRLRNRVGEAGPSSRQEGPPEEKPPVGTPGNRSDSQALEFSQQVKQEVPAEPDHVADPGRQHVMAGSSGQADQVRLIMRFGNGLLHIRVCVMVPLTCWNGVLPLRGRVNSVALVIALALKRLCFELACTYVCFVTNLCRTASSCVSHAARVDVMG